MPSTLPGAGYATTNKNVKILALMGLIFLWVEKKRQKIYEYAVEKNKAWVGGGRGT